MQKVEFGKWITVFYNLLLGQDHNNNQGFIYRTWWSFYKSSNDQTWYNQLIEARLVSLPGQYGPNLLHVPLTDMFNLLGSAQIFLLFQVIYIRSPQL